GGGVWSLAPPEQDTRLDVLRAKSAHLPTPMPEDVLAHLAEQLRGNVRELEGALNSLQHYSKVLGRPVDLALTRQVLGDLLRHSVRLVQLADVDRAVLTVLRLDAGALQSSDRDWRPSHPPLLALFLARTH